MRTKTETPVAGRILTDDELALVSGGHNPPGDVIAPHNPPDDLRKGLDVPPDPY